MTPDALAPLTVPASWAYGGVIAVRNRLYEAPGRSRRIDRPVVSVGNITTGGVGKTPFVRWLAELLQKEGHRPVIAMRGYGAARGETSDEAAEHAELLAGVDVVADPDRVGALRRYLPRHGHVDCVLLDDGFQHRRLHRDLDLVLLDATRDTLADRLLPAGRLREPPASLRRADAVVVTRAVRRDQALAGQVTRASGRPPLAWSRHVWPALRIFRGSDAPGRVERQWLQGRRVLTLLGIGHPHAVHEQLREAGAEVIMDVAAPDHARHRRSRIERIRLGARDVDAVVMTGKDWVKVRDLIDLSTWPAPIVVPVLAIDVYDGAEALTDLVLRAVRRGSRP